MTDKPEALPLPERLRAYSADTLLCDDYADAMLYGANLRP